MLLQAACLEMLPNHSHILGTHLLLETFQYTDAGDVFKALLQLLNLDHIVLHLKAQTFRKERETCGWMDGWETICEHLPALPAFEQFLLSCQEPSHTCCSASLQCRSQRSQSRGRPTGRGQQLWNVLLHLIQVEFSNHQMWILFQHTRPVLVKGSQVYLLVGRTFLYRLCVAFNRQLVPFQRSCNDVVVDGIRSTFPLWSICFLGSWQRRPVQKGPWDLQGCLRSQPPPNNNLLVQFPLIKNCFTFALATVGAGADFFSSSFTTSFASSFTFLPFFFFPPPSWVNHYHLRWY